MNTKCTEIHPATGETCSKDAGHTGAHRLAQKHRCHARGCIAPVPPERLMCLKHWRMVPRSIQREVWASYRQGQCDDMRPSAGWFSAADAAIDAVAEKEGLFCTPLRSIRGGIDG